MWIPTTQENVVSAGGSTDGWTAAGETWVFASSTTFTVAGMDVTAKYSKGTRVKLTQSATVKYFVVVGSAFGTDTTVTITGGTDYTFANAAVSANYYSYETNPQGYPGWFNYAPTWTGFSAAPAGTGKFMVVGNACIFRLADTGGTSNTTAMTVSLPVVALDTTTFSFQSARVQNNTAFPTTSGMVGPDTVNTALTAYLNWAGAAWTASGTKGVGFTYTYQF